ncbi:MAG: sigma-70 family RNA polymerase sigma factor [Lentisphaeria bacterium]|nr:sigma-70 family RNA polymerase sigma factor [Lentisphaeria bacterium]
MKMDEPEDIILIKSYIAGDERAFEILYRRYRKQLYGYLYNLLSGNTAECDEIFEETWIKVIDKLPAYRDQGKFSAWLFRIARNIFIDTVRRSKRCAMPLESGELPDVPDWSQRPERNMEEQDTLRIIENALAEIPEDQREVFLLRQQSLSFREIAEIQECPVNTVLGRMHYALRSLRKIITGKVN